MPVISICVFQATPFLVTVTKEVDRLVLRSLCLSCCCLLFMDKAVDGLAESTFAVAGILFPCLFRVVVLECTSCAS